MKKLLLALAVALSFGSAANASLLASDTRSVASDAALYDTFHESNSDFVFVKLPAGWTFVAKDAGSQAHAVFRDEATGFVYVQLSTGWKFVARTA